MTTGLEKTAGSAALEKGAAESQRKGTTIDQSLVKAQGAAQAVVGASEAAAALQGLSHAAATRNGVKDAAPRENPTSGASEAQPTEARQAAQFAPSASAARPRQSAPSADEIGVRRAAANVASPTAMFFAKESRSAAADFAAPAQNAAGDALKRSAQAANPKAASFEQTAAGALEKQPAMFEHASGEGHETPDAEQPRTWSPFAERVRAAVRRGDKGGERTHASEDGRSAGSAVVGAFAAQAGHKALEAAKAAPRKAADAVATEAEEAAGAPEGPQADALAEGDSVIEQARPSTVAGNARTAAWFSPAAHSRRVVERMDLKAEVEGGKAATLERRAEKASRKAEKAGKDTPRGRHQQRRQRRLTTKARRAERRQLEQKGVGSTRKARRSARRRARHARAAKRFGWKGVLAAACVLLLFATAAVGVVAGSTLIVGLGAAYEEETQNSTATGLSANEAVVANYLMNEMGLNAVQTAAIMGNFSIESSMDPSAVEGGQLTDPDNDDLIALGSLQAVGVGLAQWSYGRRVALATSAKSEGVPWSDLDFQLEYFAGEFESQWLLTSFYETFMAYESYDDLEAATEWFRAKWERGGTGTTDARVTEAERIYAAISGGYATGEDYDSASDAQKAIVDACMTTPATADGYCAAWVTNVYAAAGAGDVSGNANVKYIRYCTSSDTSELKVGMIVASGPCVGHTGRYRSGLGNTTSYGHVGIYIGDGYVMHSTGGSVITDTLEDWITKYQVYDITCQTLKTVKWGFGGTLA